jgi:hypothetical protein
MYVGVWRQHALWMGLKATSDTCQQVVEYNEQCPPVYLIRYLRGWCSRAEIKLLWVQQQGCGWW